MLCYLLILMSLLRLTSSSSPAYQRSQHKSRTPSVKMKNDSKSHRSKEIIALDFFAFFHHFHQWRLFIWLCSPESTAAYFLFHFLNLARYKAYFHPSLFNSFFVLCLHVIFGRPPVSVFFLGGFLLGTLLEYCFHIV